MLDVQKVSLFLKLPGLQLLNCTKLISLYETYLKEYLLGNVEPRVQPQLCL